MTLDVAWATRWMLLTREAVAANREYLIDLDRQIGDGDHGENLDRGFSQVVSVLEERPCGSVQDVLKVVAKTLMSTVGGAAGPLYGTAFLRAAKACAHEPVNAEGVAALILAALEGIQARGKAERGEKTMVDAMAPVVVSLKSSVARGEGARLAFAKAADVAFASAVATIPLRATKGRASYLGERSVGHQDPGATSFAYMVSAVASCYC